MRLKHLWTVALFLGLYGLCSAQTPVPTPSLAVASASGQAITLQWTASPGPGFQRYELYRAISASVTSAAEPLSLGLLVLGLLGLRLLQGYRGKAIGLTLLLLGLSLQQAPTEAQTSCNVPPDFTLNATIPTASTSSHTDATVSRGQSYSYFLRVAETGGSCHDSPRKLVTASDPTPTPISKIFDVTVPGTAIEGEETLVTQLHAGDQVTVQALSGAVNFNTLGFCTPSLFTTGPAGVPRSVYESHEAVPCYYPDRNCNDPLPAAPHAGLYARHGSDLLFAGSEPLTFTASSDEPFSLGVNDCANPSSPNSGSFSVQVTVTR